MNHSEDASGHEHNEHLPGGTPREDAMNQNNENDLKHDERHERLCAYLFGELEGAERSAFEAELNDDPSLKSELDKLEATVGMVTTHGGGALALSEGAAAQLAEKVQAAKPAPVIQMAWYQKPWLKVAAALVAMGGVGYVLNEQRIFDSDGVRMDAGIELADMGSTANAPAEVRVPFQSEIPSSGEDILGLIQARQEPTEKAKDNLGEALEQELLRGLGYADSRAAGAVDSRRSLGYSFAENAPVSADSALPAAGLEMSRTAELEHLGYMDAQPSGEAGVALRESARGRFEDSGDEALLANLNRYQAPADPSAKGGGEVARPELKKVEELNSQMGLGGGAGGAGGGSAPVAAPGSQAPSRAPSAGRPVAPMTGGPGAPGAIAGIGPITGGGAYKGAGDSVPPASSGGGGGGRTVQLPAATKSVLSSADYFLGDGSQGDVPEAWGGFELDFAGQQQVQDLQVFYEATKQPNAKFDALLLLQDLEGDEGGGSPGFYSQSLLERNFTFGLDSEAVDTESVFIGGLWAAQDPLFLKLEQERMQAAGLDSTGWVQMLKQFEYLPQDFEGTFDDPATQIARFHLLEPVLREQRLNELLLDVQRRPGETLDLFYYRHWGTRPFQATADDPQSTFSADVDTASYALARKMLTQGVFPTRDQIRVEEFVNYFDAGLPNPGQGVAGDSNFALSAELTPAPFGPSNEPTWLLRVGAKAREVDQSQRSPLNLTFVVDTSGSMDKENRKDLVKGALRLLVNQLDGRDTISIVRFAKDAATLIEPTPANQRGRILAAIDLLNADGGTNVEGGLLHGYNVAAQSFDADKVNRVVLLSDGVGNIGETDQGRILGKATDQRSLGIYLNTIGVGLENHNDVFLEQLADNGDGLCNYVGDAIEARKALVENFTGAFEPVARDVKLQVTFDPARVGKYRLLGYENRAIADRDFTNKKVDAAELNAGHEVVALYELQGVQFDGESPLGTFKLRYKAPFGDEQNVDELERDEETELGLSLAGSLAQFDWRGASLGFQRGALAAQTAEVLRRSGHAKGDDFDGLIAEVKRVADAEADADFREFAGLLERNQAAIAAMAPEPSEAQDLLDQLKYAQYELELERNAEGEPDPVKVASKEAAIEALEKQLRELVLVGLAKAEETLDSPGGNPAQDSLEALGYLGDDEEG